jgi:TatA/E family protein of Tat protein translocase
LVLLILESLGSTELLFILLMALIFFGPRKLPQLSRTLGKNLASFRRASDDFKRTWYQEVNLEEMAGITDNSITPPKVHSSLDQHQDPGDGQPLQPAIIRPVGVDQVISRQPASQEIAPAADAGVTEAQSEPSRKSDWL